MTDDVVYEYLATGRSAASRALRFTAQEPWMSMLLAVVLLAGNAFFVGSQIAMIAARRDQVEPLARTGRRAARVTLSQMRQLPSVLAGTQLGITACSLGLGAVAEPAVADLLEEGFHALHLPTELLHPVSFVIALAIVSYAHMVIGEMVPKNLAIAVPLRAVLLLGPPMAVWVRVTRPLLIALTAASRAVLRLFRVEPKTELTSTYTTTELADLIAESVTEGLLGPADQQRLDRALRLDQRTARSLTIPPDNLVTLRPDSTVVELEELVASTGYSRFPVRLAGTELIGYVHAKDLLELDEQDDGPLPRRLIRPMVTVDADLPLTETFTALQRAGRHMCRVTERGTTIGTVTLEDVLEELVGEIQDASHQQQVESPDSAEPPA